MLKLELFDETFDPDRTESYELSIQVSLNGFSFYVKDLVRNYFIGLGSCPFELGVVSSGDWSQQVEYITSTYNWFTKPFKRVLFSYESPSYTIVPSKYFEPEKAKQILNLSHSIDELDEVWFNTNHNGMVSIFNIPSMLITSWLKIQRDSKVLGFCDSSLQFHMQSLKEDSHPSITISFTNKFSTIIVSKGRTLLHCGSIESHSFDDTLYHMVNICKHLGVETGNTTVKTMGFIDNAETLESLIERFFKSVSVATTLGQNHFSYLLVKYKGRFANLFNQSLCE
ncbi:MAG: hypothetical protein CVT98_09390 [Bacteroidetes bacterium HGW-Bacteroidetes-15]|nr:MAG: hypothetical protein CVT98_09390 [Bacteroidetes bacterium HGW-Bacteroidetes-15]